MTSGKRGGILFRRTRSGETARHSALVQLRRDPVPEHHDDGGLKCLRHFSCNRAVSNGFTI